MFRALLLLETASSTTHLTFYFSITITKGSCDLRDPPTSISAHPRMTLEGSPTMPQPFITYNGSAEQADKDIERTTKIAALPTEKWNGPITSDLLYLLRNHVTNKRAAELRFIKTLGRLYVLTRLLAAVGFPEHALLSTRAQWHMTNVCNSFGLNKLYAQDTFQKDDFGKDGATEEVIERRRSVSMCLGMLMEILSRYDMWKLDLYKRRAKEGPIAAAFTEEETKVYKDTVADCFYMSRDLLGELVGRINARERSQV
jgi:hypothetical protein